MTQAASLLLDRVVDLAGGLTGPADLHALAELRADGRVACVRVKVEDLPALATTLKQDSTVGLVPVSVVGRTGPDEDWDADRLTDADDLNVFLNEVGEAAEVIAYEVSAPATRPEERLRDLHGFSVVELYVVVPSGDVGQECVATMAEEEWIGASIDLDLLSQPEDQAILLQSLLALDVPFRIRGGQDGQALGLLAAAALCLADDLSQREVAMVLSEPASLSWSDASIRWKQWTAGTEEIEHVRDLCGGFDVVDPVRWFRKLANWTDEGIVLG